jgi:hypothetical protein
MYLLTRKPLAVLLINREEVAMLKLTAKSNGRRRFNVFGIKGFIANRSNLSRGWKLEHQKCFTQLHLGKLSIAIEKKKPQRPLHHSFAG